MRINFFYFLYFIILFNSCASDLALKTKTSKTDIKLEMENLVIQNTIDTSLHIVGPISVYQANYLLLKNSITQLFDIYDLKNRKKTTSLDPVDLGIQKEKGNINSLYFHNFDSIFFLQNYRLSLGDTSKIYKTIDLNIDHLNEEIDMPRYFHMNLGHFPIRLDQKSQNLLIQSYCSACYFYKKEYYESEIESAVDLNSQVIKHFPIGYPTLYHKNYYGFSNLIAREVVGELSYYSFFADPNIYEFNRNTHQTRTYGGKSSYHIGNSPHLANKHKYDNNKKRSHMQLVNSYHEILHDPYKNLFYRFFKPAISIKNLDGTYNAWGDKNSVLMVFNSELELIHEQMLPKYTYNIHKSFVTQEGLHIIKTSESKTDPSTLEIDVFNFRN